MIVDIKMPGMDGIACAREISADRLAAVLLLTAFSQRDLIQQASEAGALAYLVKPFQRSELVPAIELALARFPRATRHRGRGRRTGRTARVTRKAVDRAKGRLMDELAMTEQRAYRHIQTEAMAQRTTMRSVAEAIVAAEALPIPSPAVPDRPRPPTPQRRRTHDHGDADRR